MVLDQQEQASQNGPLVLDSTIFGSQLGCTLLWKTGSKTGVAPISWFLIEQPMELTVRWAFHLLKLEYQLQIYLKQNALKVNTHPYMDYYDLLYVEML